MSADYYLIHGRMLDSEHESIDSSTERANEIMADQGLNHSIIMIGNRALNQENDILVMSYRLAEFPRKD